MIALFTTNNETIVPLSELTAEEKVMLNTSLKLRNLSAMYFYLHYNIIIMEYDGEVQCRNYNFSYDNGVFEGVNVKLADGQKKVLTIEELTQYYVDEIDILHKLIVEAIDKLD